MAKLGRNSRCPCGRVKKYKHCCRGQVDWDQLLKAPISAVVPHLSVRGRNLLFLELLAGALQLDQLSPKASMKEMKAAFTPDAIRQIHEAVDVVWENDAPYESLFGYEPEVSSGLYVGMYEPRSVVRGVTRHSLYADRILLVDPFQLPRNIRPEFNAVEHPEKNRHTTLKWSWLWLVMAGWIESDLIHFVRTPGDYDLDLERAAWNVSLARRDRHPELQLEANPLAQSEIDDWFESQKNQLLLSYPDDHFRELIKKNDPTASDELVESAIRYIQRKRDEDPFYVEPPKDRASAELLQVSSGASYEMSKLVTEVTGSHLITDIRQRWREIELDRSENAIELGLWTPFAKAFHDLPFRYLDAVPLDAALTLRGEERLGDLRSFFRRTWKSAAPENDLSDAAVAELAAELTDHLRDAELEWDKIDRDLVKWFGTEFAGGALGLGPAIALGGAEWAGVALAAAGMTNLVVSSKKRAEYRRRFPAAFLADLRKDVA